MAGSHEVRGSIPLGSTTDSRGARRRRRAPLLFPGMEKKARGARLLLGVAAGRLALARAAREEAAPDPLGRIEAIRSGAGTHSALGRLGPAEFEEADWPKEDGRPKAAQTPSTESGQIRIRRQRVREPRHRRPAGGARCPEAPLPQGRPVRRRRHRARQRGPEEGARLSEGVRRPRPAPPRARPMRPAAQRGGDAFGAGLHGPRGVRERGIVPVKNA